MAQKNSKPTKTTATPNKKMEPKQVPVPAKGKQTPPMKGGKKC